jgi:predicted DNA-binding transcriptional regulator YafY
LTDIGQIEEAKLIAELLLERSELSLPLRAEIERFLQNLPPPWRLDIDRHILRQQPFELSYQDAAERLWNFTVHHAKVTPHEKRLYLDCWCEETEGNQDIPELTHNWCLRLDRIQDAAVTPTEGKWLSSLAQIEVEMHLLRGLAFAYQAKPEDSENDWLPDQPRVRRVVRKVSSTFWFLREVMQYAEDCVIVSPESVRSRLTEKLIALCRQYGYQLISNP